MLHSRFDCLTCALCTIVGVLYALLLASCSSLLPPSTDAQTYEEAQASPSSEPAAADDEQAEGAGGEASAQDGAVADDKVAYLALPEHLRAVYDQLLAGVNTLEESFVVTGVAAEEIGDIYKGMVCDHPELFWLDGSARYQWFEGSADVTVIPGLNVERERIPEIRAQIEAAADQFLATLPPDASEYDVAKAAYTYVIETTDYDANVAQSQNIQSVFIDHRSVCAGYAHAYQYLLHRAGQYCAYVSGSIPWTNGEDDGHAWNLVRIDGTYSYVDVTWGDPTYANPSDANKTGTSYDYLCLTTDEILRTEHKFENEALWPVCDSDAYDYYRLNGLLFDTYDEWPLSQSLWAQLDAEAGEGRDGDSPIIIRFKFSNAEAYQQAHDSLYNDEFLSDDVLQVCSWTHPEEGDTGRYKYSYNANDELHIIKLYL